MAAASSEAELVAELLEYVLPVERFVVSLPRSLGTSWNDDDAEDDAWKIVNDDALGNSDADYESGSKRPLNPDPKHFCKFDVLI